MAFDTKTVTVHQDDLTFLGDEEFNWSEEQVKCVVSHAFEKTEIGEQTNYRNFGVSEIVSGNDNSKTAYIETDSGYFILSASMLQHIIVTYSRWD